MNPILEHQPVCYDSDVEELLQIARDQFAGDFVTGVHYIFARPELTDLAEVQIYPCLGYQNEARSELRKQFEAGRVFMKAHLMFNCDVPWRVIESPAYRESVRNRRNFCSGGCYDR